MFNRRLDLLTDYPFRRLAALLQEPPGAPPLVMSIGEPQHPPPAMLADVLAGEAAGWAKYPPMAGTPAFRAAAAAWLTRRYRLPADAVEPDRHILPLVGSREGLFQIAQVVCDETAEPPVVLLPNPFYQVYAGAALLAGAHPVFVPAVKETGFLPDFSGLSPDLLDRTALAYLCSPANPQGAVASVDRLKEAVGLARRHRFVLAVDECYSEIYHGLPPAGGLEACAALGDGFDQVVVFQSLSKRSSVPGLRSGFAAGDERVIAALARRKAYSGAALPLPILAASTALWQDEAHVEVNRALYRAKFDAAEERLAGRFGFYRPAGGFYLWLAVADGQAAARKLWLEAGIRVLPGAYLGRPDATGTNPGDGYIRVALVQDLAATQSALERLAKVLGDG
jgi:N-succinyldiaminopimelate aminotransferase